MADLRTTYMGIELDNPLIVGSCTLSSSVDSAKRIEAAGAGALVVRSIFEEQIRSDAETVYRELESADSAAAYEYLNADFPMLQGAERYFEKVAAIIRAVKIPVMASVNCRHLKEWAMFSGRIQDCGAAALEVNLYDIPDDMDTTGAEIEQRHEAIIEAILGSIRIPVSVKLSPFYSALPNFVCRLDARGARGFVLFNRFLQPDISINPVELVGHINYSRPSDSRLPLRWTALLSRSIKADICLSSGVHGGSEAIKAILAGASAFQVCSTLYANGLTVIPAILKHLSTWMTDQGYASLAEFKGQLSAEDLGHAKGFDRTQYVRMLGSLD